MTPKRRSEIFSKEALSIKDVAELMEIAYSTAASLVQRIRFNHDRLGIKGRVHILDFMDFFDVPDNRARYADLDIGAAEEKNVSLREEWWKDLLHSKMKEK